MVFKNRLRKEWAWRCCGTPFRAQSMGPFRFASGSEASDSNKVTEIPRLASWSALVSPPMLAPITAARMWPPFVFLNEG